MKRVLIIGNSLILGRTEEVYQRAFRAHGCEVRTCTLEEFQGPARNRTVAQRVMWRALESWMLRPFNAHLLAEARSFRPDLVFTLFPRVIFPETLKVLQSLAPVFAFFTDSPLDAHHTHRSRVQDATLPLWDCTLIYGSQLAADLVRAGARRAEYHPFSCDLDYHRPVPGLSPDCDVTFIGNWDVGLKRERYLHALSHVRVKLWGEPTWLSRGAVDVRPFYQGTCAYDEIPKALGSGRIALNIMRDQNLDSHNIRTFEIIACGTLMLSERTPELLTLFREGEEAVYFTGEQELRSRVDWLLAHPQEAAAIAKRGFALAATHAVGARIRQIESLWTEMVGKQRSRAAG